MGSTVFNYSNTAMVGSNSTRSMDVAVCTCSALYCTVYARVLQLDYSLQRIPIKCLIAESASEKLRGHGLNRL